MSTVRWQMTWVHGRSTSYGEAGREDRERETVVFLHGWALSDRTYRRSLERLADNGYAVLAPALPGFGASAPLRREELSLAGYAAWLVDFLAAVDVPGPVTLVGHSFGGAVAIKAAHGYPEMVGRLVLVNFIGGAGWSSHGEPRALADRPLGDWGVHLGAELLSVHGLTRVLPVIAVDAVTHALTRPLALWRVGRLAREANLVVELDALKQRGTPVVVLWGREDTVLPWACAESLISALGDPQVVTVRGDHGWLIGDSHRFAEVLTNVLGLGAGPRDGQVA